LKKEPRRRNENATALANDLERFVQGKLIAARPVRASGVVKGQLPHCCLTMAEGHGSMGRVNRQATESARG
jgi:hypothetical protein